MLYFLVGGIKMFIRSHDNKICLDISAIVCLEKEVISDDIINLLARASCLSRSVELLHHENDKTVEDLIAYISKHKDNQ